jgi:hypothetical protein
MDKNWLRQVPLRDETHPEHPATAERVMERLDDEAAMDLLAGAPYGRIVFVYEGGPQPFGAIQIRPLSHLVDGGDVIVRTRLNAVLSDAVEQGDGLQVTFEADMLDVEQRLGWSVILSGIAAPVVDPARQSRYKDLLRTMLAETEDTVIAIRPKSVTGIRIVPAPAAQEPGDLEHSGLPARNQWPIRRSPGRR